ncbi:hypothetical protein [Trichloromonas sp.]|uniref:hypothetical protein n=1 Tax=Trichloromonas sp. TaxID=3069249 RepID=UPI002A491758|nr:hypothetical protein [Trichloromonas sp.]
MPQRIVLALAIVAGMVTAWPTPFAQAFSGQLQGIYGQVENDELEGGEASLAVGSRFGLQLDGAYAELGEDQLKGVGLHLLYRESESYLLGLLADHAELQDVDLNRVGVEGELYAGPVTLAATIGHQIGDIDDIAFGVVDLRWYPGADLMLVAGGSLADSEDDRVHLGAEYQMMGGVSGYVDLAAGENRYDHALAGLRYYFGGDKELMQRHRREAAPNPIITNVLQGLAGIRSRQQELAR